MRPSKRSVLDLSQGEINARPVIVRPSRSLSATSSDSPKFGHRNESPRSHAELLQGEAPANFSDSVRSRRSVSAPKPGSQERTTGQARVRKSGRKPSQQTASPSTRATPSRHQSSTAASSCLKSKGTTPSRSHSISRIRALNRVGVLGDAPSEPVRRHRTLSPCKEGRQRARARDVHTDKAPETNISGQTGPVAPNPKATGKKRVSLRLQRQQKKAATRIQSIIRKFLARVVYRKRLIQRDYLQYVTQRKQQHAIARQQQEEFMSRIVSLEEQTHRDICQMRKELECEKQRVEPALRQEIEFVLRQEEDLRRQRFEEESTNANSLFTRLKMEENQLRAEMTLLEDMICEAEQEGEALEAANAKIASMFGSLRTFVEVNVATKQKLELAARECSKTELSKLRKEIKVVGSFAMVETIVKNMYRGHVYRQAYGTPNRMPTKRDHLVSLSVITQCENELGNTVLNPKEAEKLFEISDSDDDEEEDDDDDSNDN